MHKGSSVDFFNNSEERIDKYLDRLVYCVKAFTIAITRAND